MKRFIIILPLLITVFLFVILLIYLLQNKDPRKPPSALLNQPLPEFYIKGLINEDTILSNNTIKNKITLINFFASWCAPCKVEHPLLMNLKKKYPELTIVGINFKDNNEDAIKFLLSTGNPYNFVGVDNNGAIGLEFGVFGLPETFFVNNQGKIIFKQTGPLTKKIIQNDIIPNL